MNRVNRTKAETHPTGGMSSFGSQAAVCRNVRFL